MFTTLFLIIAAVLFFKLAVLAFRMTWGIGKVLLSIVFLPLFLIGIVLRLFWLLVPIILIGVVVTLVMKDSSM